LSARKIGVSRDPADQEPLVHKEAQAVADLLGTGMTIPREVMVSVSGSPDFYFDSVQVNR